MTGEPFWDIRPTVELGVVPRRDLLVLKSQSLGEKKASSLWGGCSRKKTEDLTRLELAPQTSLCARILWGACSGADSRPYPQGFCQLKW